MAYEWHTNLCICLVVQTNKKVPKKIVLKKGMKWEDGTSLLQLRNWPTCSILLWILLSFASSENIFEPCFVGYFLYGKVRLQKWFLRTTIPKYWLCKYESTYAAYYDSVKIHLIMIIRALYWLYTLPYIIEFNVIPIKYSAVIWRYSNQFFCCVFCILIK